MIEDFRANWASFFSKGYLNSDGRKALIRFLRAGLQIAFDLKPYALKKYKRGAEQDVDAILLEFETRLTADAVTFKYSFKPNARTHE